MREYEDRPIPGTALTRILQAGRATGSSKNVQPWRFIVLRDPESGLLDFPSRREGRLVYLCWRLEEDRVGFWHGPDSGFSGRRPI